jgi:hypothetical protein
MTRLNLTHEQVRSRLLKFPSIHQDKREAVAQSVIHLSEMDDWYPDALRRELRKLQSKGLLNEAERHLIEKEFFPEHAW